MAEPTKAVCLVSRDIKPYIQALEGIKLALEGTSVKLSVFYLDKFAKSDVLQAKLTGKGYHLFMGIGTQASRFIWQELHQETGIKLYTMLLNPQKILTDQTACGISLNIPVKFQFETMTKMLPHAQRIGLLYDPANNTAFYQTARYLAKAFKVQIVPLQVKSSKQISLKLKKNWSQIDALWLIPDHTVISESIIQYIIKKALLKKIPVIGYNRFFYQSGAVLNFIVDYQKIGQQTVTLALDLLEGKNCPDQSPQYYIWWNQKAAERLGLDQP